MGNTSTSPKLGFVVLVAVLGLASWRLMAPWLQAGDCDLSSENCLIMLDGQRLEIEIVPRRPFPGQELQLFLRPAFGVSPGVELGDVSVDFSMPGMDMGEQMMELETTGRGVMEGRISLPSCPMGQSIWSVSIRHGQEAAEEMVLHAEQ